MQPTVTVTVCVPVMDGFWVAVAVTVAEPVATEVTRPLELIVAILLSLGLMLQLTAGLPLLPSLKVPTANICTVLFVLPVWMLGEPGPTEIDDNVGFTKKPLQLTARAKAPSMAQAPIKPSFDFIDDMCS